MLLYHQRFWGSLLAVVRPKQILDDIQERRLPVCARPVKEEEALLAGAASQGVPHNACQVGDEFGVVVRHGLKKLDERRACGVRVEVNRALHGHQILGLCISELACLQIDNAVEHAEQHVVLVQILSSDHEGNDALRELHHRPQAVKLLAPSGVRCHLALGLRAAQTSSLFVDSPGGVLGELDDSVGFIDFPVRPIPDDPGLPLRDIAN